MLSSKFIGLTSLGIIIVSSACAYLLIGGWSGALLAFSLFLAFFAILVRASSPLSAIMVGRWGLICLATVYVIGLAALFFVTPIQAQLYVPPAELSIAVWFRHFVAVLFTTLLPGYLLLRILDPGCHIKTLEVFALSYILSVFLTFLVGYLAILLGQQIGQVSVYCVAFLNSVLLVTFAWRSHRRLNNSDNARAPGAIRNVKRIGLWNILFLVGIVGLTVFFTYGLMGTQIIGDQRNIHGLALVMEQTSLSKDSVAFPSYPWLMIIYMAMMFAASGLPSVNAYNFLNIMNVFAVLAFFIMVRSLFRKRPKKDVIAAVSTFIAFFTSGFGWVVVLGSTISGASGSLSQHIYQAWTQTYDILTSNSFVTSGHPDVTTSLLLGALPAMFLAFGIAVSDDESISTRLRVSLLALLIVIGYLAHPETVVILGSILVISLFLKNGLWNLLSGALGLVGVLAVDLSSPSHFYLSRYASLLGFRAPLLAFLLSGFVAGLAVFLGIRSIRNLVPICTQAASKVGNRVLTFFGRAYSRSGFFFAAIYLYLLGFVFWVLQQSAAVVPYFFGLDGSVPWYFYPIRLGIPGLVAILGTVYWLVTGQFKTLKLLTPLYVWMLITLLASPFYLEYRLVKQLYLPVSIASSFVLIRLIENQHSTLSKVTTGHAHLPKIPQANLAVLLTLLVIIASIGSPLLYAYAEQRQDYSGVAGILPRRAPFTAMEFEALNWVRNNTESGTLPVIALSSYLGNNVVDMAGVWPVLANRYMPFFQVSDPANLFDLIGRIQPRYMYISHADLQVLQAEGYQTNLAIELAKYLPIAFNNSEATVYEVPSLVGPSLESSVAVPESSSMFSLAMLGLAGVNYTIFRKDDPNMFNHGTIILSDYPTTDELVRIEDWAEGGGHLVILGIPPDPSLSTSYDAHNGAYFGLSPPSSHWYLRDNSTLESKGGIIVSKENYSAQYIVETKARVVQINNPNDNHLGLFLGFKNPDSYYYAFLRQNMLVLCRKQMGVGQEVFHKSVQMLEGAYHKIVVKVTPPTLYFYLNGEYVGQYSDPQFLGGGSVGLSVYNLIGNFERLDVHRLPVADLPIDEISTGNLTLTLPKLYVPNFNQTTLPSENLSVSSYYTLDGKQVAPFSIVRSIGLGDITYVNFEPLVSFLSDTGAQPAKQFLFMRLGSLLSAIAPTLPYINRFALNIMEAIPYVQGKVNCTGSAVVETDSILFHSPASPVSPLVQIDLSDAVVANITGNSTAVLHGNYKLQGELLVYNEGGTVRTYVNAPWLVLSNTHSGVYPQIAVPLESHWDSVISSSSGLSLTLRVDGRPVSVLISGGTVKGHFVNSSEGDSDSGFTQYAIIYARYPSLLLQGQTYIENAFLSTGPNEVIALGASVVVSGSMSFRILSVDQTTVRIANLSLSGTISHMQSQNKPGVGLLEALISPFNLLIAASALVATFIAFGKFKRHF